MFSLFLGDMVGSSDLQPLTYPDLLPTPYDHTNHLLNWVGPVVFVVVIMAVVFLILVCKRNRDNTKRKEGRL